MLSNLGQKLGKLACSDEKTRGSLIHECDELAKAIAAKAAEVEPANGNEPRMFTATKNPGSHE